MENIRTSVDWTKSDLEKLKDIYSIYPTDTLVNHFKGRSYGAIRRMAHHLKLKKSKNISEASVKQLLSAGYSLQRICKIYDVGPINLLKVCDIKGLNKDEVEIIFYSLKRRVLTEYKTGAKNRGYSFDLKEEDFFFLVSQNCYYCDIVPSNFKKFFKSEVGYRYNGIDRVDNSKGYFLDNCVTCCSKCNIMKMDLDKTEFLNKIKAIYEKHITPKEGSNV